MLPTYAPAIFSVIVYILMRCRASTSTRYVSRFRFDPLERFQIEAFRISVDGRPKSIECMRFQTKKRWPGSH